MALNELRQEIKKAGKNYWSHPDDTRQRLDKMGQRYPHEKIVAELRNIVEDDPGAVLIVAMEVWLADLAAQIILCDTKGGYLEEMITLACQFCSDSTVITLWRERNCV